MKRQFLSLASVLSLFLGAKALANECEHRILFIPQLHMDQLDEHTSARALEQIAKIQFKIAQELVQHKQEPIFAEGTYFPINLSYYRANADQGEQRVAEYLKAVPGGLPKRYSDLNSNQKTMLSEAGADLFLLFLGEIPEILPIATDAQLERKYFQMAQTWVKNHPGKNLFDDPEMYAIGKIRRERLALEQIKNYFESHPNVKRAILIFGADHDFQKYPDLFDPSCIETSMPIKQAIEAVL